MVDDEWPAAKPIAPATTKPVTIAAVEIPPDEESAPEELHGHHLIEPSGCFPHGHNAGSAFGTSPTLAPPALDAGVAANELPENIIANDKINALKFFITDP